METLDPAVSLLAEEALHKAMDAIEELGRRDVLCHDVAHSIVQAVKRGGRNPERLYEIALTDIETGIAVRALCASRGLILRIQTAPLSPDDSPMGRVLIVDDDKLVRDTIAAALFSLGFEPVSVCSPIEGIERAEFDAAIFPRTVSRTAAR
jgi:hypothetical protein